MGRGNAQADDFTSSVSAMTTKERVEEWHLRTPSKQLSGRVFDWSLYDWSDEFNATGGDSPKVVDLRICKTFYKFFHDVSAVKIYF